MAEVVRRRYSRILRESSAAAGEDAEFNQESPFEAAQRLSSSQPSTLNAHPISGLPDLIIVDGGKGQLSSACKELQRLGLHEQPIVGLAKEFEEIYRPGRPLPLRLPEDSGALKLLQRIRDEAHRFANGYHSLLLKRRISESRLDDIPGVSEARKKALLAKFGSVERIRRATPEALAEVPGISARLAGEILSALAS
jgi:excinuclease ABC subunit C